MAADAQLLARIKVLEERCAVLCAELSCDSEAPWSEEEDELAAFLDRLGLREASDRRHPCTVAAELLERLHREGKV